MPITTSATGFRVKEDVQKQIDDAIHGAVIYVPPDEYCGPFVLRKPLTLRGGPGTTLFSTVGPVLTIDSPGVALEDLVIEVADALANGTDRCAMLVKSGNTPKTNNVKVKGSVIGIPGEEGIWDLPTVFEFKTITVVPGIKSIKKFHINVPTACTLVPGIDGLSVAPSSLPAGTHTIELQLELSPGANVFGDLRVCTPLVWRSVSVTANASASSVEKFICSDSFSFLELLGLVPPEATIVCGVHVDATKGSPFGQYVISRVQTNGPEFQRFLQKTGFDPTRDLSEVLAAITNTSSSQMSGLVLGTGTFNPSAFITALGADGPTLTTTYKNSQVIIIEASEDDSSAVALAFLNCRTALMGTLDLVIAAIDRFVSGSPTVLPQTVSSQIASLNAANNAWFLSTVPVSEFLAGKVANTNLGNVMLGNLLQAVQQASVGMKFKSTGVQITGQAVTSNVVKLLALIHKLVALIQSNKDDDPRTQQLASLLNTMQVSTQDAITLLSLSIPEPILEQLFM